MENLLKVNLNGVEFVNLTPHPINLVGDVEMTFPASGVIARVTSTVTPLSPIAGVPVVGTVLGEVENIILEKGEIGIVSAMVLSAMKEVNHPLLGQVVAPNTGAAIRNEKGHIVGVPGFTV